MVAIVCYKPFWDFFYQHYVQYKGQSWEHWLSDSPMMMFVWGGAILLLTLIYAWASLSFGLRFSNLTYRGLISNGPYRWSKHPAYLCKIISWWMISIPFLVEGTTAEATRHCLALCVNNLLYIWRAKTEEAHLRRYPEYEAYHQWMIRNGVVSRHLHRLECWVRGRL
jgi:isoprenylcysteine carboxyl methyltransferase (ICMT) family protein YpbQ